MNDVEKQIRDLEKEIALLKELRKLTELRDELRNPYWPCKQAPYVYYPYIQPVSYPCWPSAAVVTYGSSYTSSGCNEGG